MKLRLIIYFVFILFCQKLSAQNVGINNPAPAASALLDLTSIDKGLLTPRMSSAQRIAISLPATGLLVYDTTLNTFFYFNGTIWIALLNSASGWGITGNAGTVAATNFLGTTDAKDLVMRTNNMERLRIKTGGATGSLTSLGTNLTGGLTAISTGLATLEVFGNGVSTGDVVIHAATNSSDRCTTHS